MSKKNTTAETFHFMSFKEYAKSEKDWAINRVEAWMDYQLDRDLAKKRFLAKQN